MKQHQDYDKIIKETVETLGTPILHKLLGVDTSNIKDVPSALPRTLERRADYLKSVLDSRDGVQKLFHFEFQSEVHPKMAERMLVYYSLFWEKYNLPIEQYVIYLGSGTWTAPSNLYHKNLNFSYQVISLHTIDYELFLNSEYPEEVILAVLGNFKHQDKTVVLEKILTTLKAKAKQPELLQKLLTQLEILSKLRNLQPQIIQTISNMPITYDITTDLRFLEGVEKGVGQGIEQGIEKGIEQGIEKGIEQGIEKGVEKQALLTAENLLKTQRFSDEEVAFFSFLPIEKVLELKKKLGL